MSEIRGIWLLSHFNSPVLTSKSNIKNALYFLEESGFNTLFIAVWNRGYTAFKSEVMVKYGFPQQDPKYVELGIDPLQEIINQAKGRNFAIFPWFEYGFAASPQANGGHILTIKPEWSAIAQSGDKVKHGGLIWMNSLNREVQQFITKLLLEVIEKYDITGVQGCDRLPALPHFGGYDQETKNKYKSHFGSYPPSQTKQENWVKFRADLLTNYLKELHTAIKIKDSNCLLSIAPCPFKFGLDNLLQDSETWLKQGIVDFLCPQWYRENFFKYKREVDNIYKKFSGNMRQKIVPGIAFTANKTNLKANDIINCVNYNRKKGLGGQVFFFYEGLTKNNQEMASALKSGADYSNLAPPFA